MRIYGLVGREVEAIEALGGNAVGGMPTFQTACQGFIRARWPFTAYAHEFWAFLDPDMRTWRLGTRDSIPTSGPGYIDAFELARALKQLAEAHDAACRLAG